MQINFTGHNVEVTEALRNLVEKKFERVERHFNHQMISASVIFSVQKLENSAEIILHVKGGDVTAKATAEDMYKAVDLMMDKLNRQLIKRKQRLTEHQGNAD